MKEAVWRGCGCSQLHKGCSQHSPKHPRLPSIPHDRQKAFNVSFKKKRPRHKFTQGGVCLSVQTKCSGSRFSACTFQPMHSAFCRADVLLHEVLGSHLPFWLQLTRGRGVLKRESSHLFWWLFPNPLEAWIAVCIHIQLKDVPLGALTTPDQKHISALLPLLVFYLCKKKGGFQCVFLSRWITKQRGWLTVTSTLTFGLYSHISAFLSQCGIVI